MVMFSGDTYPTTPLLSEQDVHGDRTDMIGMTTAVDSKEVLVILHSMKSAVSHFVGDRKYYSRVKECPMMLLQRFCVFIFKEIVDIVSLKLLQNYICIVLNLLTGITEAQTCGCRG